MEELHKSSKIEVLRLCSRVFPGLRSIAPPLFVGVGTAAVALRSPAKRTSIMAPVPKKVAGVCATEKRARKARPSHNKGVSLSFFFLLARSGAARFGGGR